MASILEEFAYGNICPQSQPFQKNSPYGEALEMVSRNEKKLLELLSGKEKEVFEAYIDMRDEASQIEVVRNLIYGFKLGLTMAAEAFLTSDGLVAGGGD